MQDISLLHSVQTGSEVDPASIPVGTGGSFLGNKEADHSPPSRMVELYLHFPIYLHNIVLNCTRHGFF
jgi:hypothetical protein